mmetsp:Transcript_17881/g.49543  ORF Transcript_17881/g.49543 Transcript_17881/m.49543 type:complete len:207 (+) Transcript_17881:517-1137(+)
MSFPVSTSTSPPRNIAIACCLIPAGPRSTRESPLRTTARRVTLLADLSTSLASTAATATASFSGRRSSPHSCSIPVMCSLAARSSSSVPHSVNLTCSSASSSTSDCGGRSALAPVSWWRSSRVTRIRSTTCAGSSSSLLLLHFWKRRHSSMDRACARCSSVPPKVRMQDSLPSEIPTSAPLSRPMRWTALLRPLTAVHASMDQERL